jgi:excisionase family DNA binding protein
MEKQILTSVSYDTFINDIKEVVKDLIPKSIQQPNDDKKENNLLTRKETAELLNVSIGTISNYTRNGKLKTYEIGGTIRLKKNEVLESLIKS